MTGAHTATVPRVGNPKRVLSPEDEAAIRAAMDAAEQAKSDAEGRVRAAILAAHYHGASFRVLAEFTGRSTSSISAWKKSDKPN